MTDVRLELGTQGADLVLEGDDLSLDEGLLTPVLVSVLSDARAPGEASALGLEPDKRGWWADSIRDRFGSRLWTLEREKRTPETLARARELGRDSLGWLVDDGIAERLEVVADYDAFGRLRLEVEIHRGTAPLHAALWAGTQKIRVELIQPAASEPPPDPSPEDDLNVVVLIFDDGGAELFPWTGMLAPSEGYAPTPNLDRFRELGVTFTQARASSICSPSRSWLHTGRAGWRTGGLGNLDGDAAEEFGLGDYGTPPQSLEVGIARALRLGRDGTADQTLGSQAFTYASAWFGKGHIFSDAGRELYPVSHGWGRYVGCPPNSQSLEDWPVGQLHPNAPSDPGYVAVPANSGHFHFREIQTIFGGAVTHETFGAGGTWPAGGPYEAWNPTTSPRAAWDAYKVTRDVIGWANARTQPFLAFVNINPPHGPFEVPPFTAPDTVGVGATGGTIDLLSSTTRDAMIALAGTADAAGFRPTTGAGIRAVYRANLEAVDTLLGLLYDRLDPAKRAKTVFVFMGDNGTVPQGVAAPYDPLRTKRTLFEMGQRVPCIVWGSSQAITAPNRDCAHLVHIGDLFSTVLELTRCNPELWNPGGAIVLDSKSIAPVLRDPAAPPARTRLYNEIASPIGGRLHADPMGDPPIPAIDPGSWTQSWTDGEYKITRLVPDSDPLTPAFRFAKVTADAQPGSGQPGYLELPADDLYLLATDGFHPPLTAKFEALLAELDAYLET